MFFCCVIIIIIICCCCCCWFDKSLKFAFDTPCQGYGMHNSCSQMRCRVQKNVQSDAASTLDFKKRKCSLKRLKYEYKTNVLPYVYACQLWALKNYTALVRGLFVCIVFLFVLMSTLARPNITLSDNPTLEDLHMTGSVVVFEGQ